MTDYRVIRAEWSATQQLLSEEHYSHPMDFSRAVELANKLNETESNRFYPGHFSFFVRER
jgi:hypothetical protein